MVYQHLTAGLIVLDHRLVADDVLSGTMGFVMELPLSATERTVLRARRRTGCGRDVLLQLPREGALQPGERLTDSQEQVEVRVTAASEALLRVEAETPLALLTAAYHLGNRHVALELHEHELLLLDDSVLASMLESRGLMVTHCVRPFMPEGGAYHHHHHR